MGPPPPPSTHRLAERDVLIVLAGGAGAVDALSFLGLDGVFTGNMTGNLVLLGISAGQGALGHALRSALAFAAFVTAMLLAAPRAHRHTIALLSVQLALQSAVWVWWVAVGTHPGDGATDALIVLLAVAMGIQSAVVRELAGSWVSTTYITGMLAGLLRDLTDRTGDHIVLRILLLLALPAGAVVAGAVMLGARAVAPAIPCVATGAVLVAVAVAHRRGNPAPR